MGCVGRRRPAAADVAGVRCGVVAAAAPPGAELRAVLVRDGGALVKVGLAPLYLDPRRPGLRLPGIELGGRLAPLALEGHQRAVAGALAGALAGSPAFPDLLALEGVPLAARPAPAR